MTQPFRLQSTETVKSRDKSSAYFPEMHHYSSQRSFAADIQSDPIPGNILQRQCHECREELRRQPVGQEIQTKPSAAHLPIVGPEKQEQISNLPGGGLPLSKSERSFFEPRFGYDFNKVRLHTGTYAANTARALSARAYTLGNNIVFGTGQYRPETAAGKKLLAHELAHTIQQSKSSPSGRLARAIDWPRWYSSPKAASYAKGITTTASPLTAFQATSSPIIQRQPFGIRLPTG